MGVQRSILEADQEEEAHSCAALELLNWSCHDT